MKSNYKLWLAGIAIVILCAPLSAQSKQNLFKANLLSPVVRTGSFFYERMLSEDASLQLGFFYTGASFDDTRFRGFGLTPEYRYYLSAKPAPQGIFVAPFLRYQNFNVTVENSTDEATYSSFGGGLLVGAQTLLKDVISLEAFIGPSYSSGKIDVSSGSEEDFDIDYFDGFGIRFGITIGIAF